VLTKFKQRNGRSRSERFISDRHYFFTFRFRVNLFCVSVRYLDYSIMRLCFYLLFTHVCLCISYACIVFNQLSSSDDCYKTRLSPVILISDATLNVNHGNTEFLSQSNRRANTCRTERVRRKFIVGNRERKWYLENACIAFNGNARITATNARYHASFNTSALLKFTLYAIKYDD